MKTTAILIMVITIISKLFGFAREMVLSYFYGATNISDIYLTSTTIPATIFSFISAIIAVGFIPIYTSIEKEDGIEEGNKFTSNLTNIFMILSSIIFLFLFFFAKPIVKLFALGFEGEILDLAIKFTRITSISIFFAILINIFSKFLQIKNRYLVTAFMGVPLNIVSIIFIFLSQKTNNIFLLPIGYMLATVSQFLILIPFIKKVKYKHEFIFNLKDKHIKNLFSISIPIMIGNTINQIGVIIDKTLASSIAVGGMSALNYANMIEGFIIGVVVVSISTSMYPRISKMAVENNIKDLKKTILEAANIINIILVPSTFGLMIFSKEIAILLFARGAFDDTAVSMTSNGLFFYAIGIVAIGLRDILTKAFYALKDTKTPMINGIIFVCMDIVLNIVLGYFMGISGLAFSTSISIIVVTALLFVRLRKKIGPFGVRGMINTFIKTIFASTIMGIITKIVYKYLHESIGKNRGLLVTILIAAIIYFLILLFIKIEEVDSIVDTVKKRLKRK